MENHSANNAQSWIRPEILELSAYHVPDASGMVKLDAMENPYTWPAELREEWASLIAETDVNRYPDPGAAQLKQRLRAAMSIPRDMSVILGNGSDELIQMIAMALAGPGRSVLSVDPGFVMYRMIAVFCGMRYVGVPLAADFSLDSEAVLQAMDIHQPAVVFLAYPNNPTGNLFDRDALVRIIQAAPGVVVIDEAYAPFADDSFMSMLGHYDNLLVMRTVSKMGLAGLRLGLLAGPGQWLDEFDKVRLPYNINVLTQKSAEFALRHQAVFDEQTALIREQRTVLDTALRALPGVQVYPSDANFILIRLESGRAAHVFNGLKQQGILVKMLSGSVPALQECLRVTVGTEQENRQFLDAFQSLL